MKKTKIGVCGMHCKSCELLLEKSIKKLGSVTKVTANEKKGTVEIEYSGDFIDMKAINEIIKECGYSIGEKKKLPWLQKNSSDYIDLIMALFIILALYILFSALGINFGSIGSSGTPTFTVALLVGFTAGISSCMALVGGLILGVSAKWSEDNIKLSRIKKFEPHLFFNLGRILGFGILGGILGIFGSIFTLSAFAIGTMTVIVGLIMFILGINLTEISPKISSFTLTLPKFLGKNVGKDNGSSKHIFALTTGALTFFLPCGFTLAMQAYAISSGNFTSGAMIMMAFAIGTAPGLLGIGGLSSVLSGKIAKKFFKFTGVIMVLLSIFNISNGYNLISLGGQTNIQTIKDTSKLPTQEVYMTQGSDGYTPNEIHLKPNTKIKWIIKSTNIYSCSSTIVVPSLGITKNLVSGDNIIEFISPASGEIKFSCSMGMYNGKFVIDGDNSTSGNISNNLGVSTASASSQKCGAGKGSSGCLGSTTVTGANGSQGGGCPMMRGRNSVAIDTDSSNILDASTNDSGIISAIYTTNGMSPQEFNLKEGKTYELTINVKDTIEGCMSQIMIPGFDENIQDLTSGNTVKFTIKADKKGKFPITCAMGVPHGYININ